MTNTRPRHTEEDAGKQKTAAHRAEPEPDMTYPAIPNYDKFRRMGWTIEQTLVRLNVD